MFHPKIIQQHQLRDGAILIIDVDYRGTDAVVSGVLIQDWESTECAVINHVVEGVAPYEPGAFYKRELPCIMALLEHLEVAIGCIVIDGYVYLGADKEAGLGAHLHHAIKAFSGVPVPVIGVAKTYFKGTPVETEVVRNNAKPLFVTSIGGDEKAARECIRTMAGDFRIPGMIKYVDHICRTYHGIPAALVEELVKSTELHPK